MDLNLGGRTAVVTGASKGIGLAVTAALAAEGAAVVAGARGTSPELQALSDRHDVRFVPVDLSTADGPAALIDAARAAHGRIDLLVNNVGASEPAASVLDFDDDQWRRLWELNFLAAVRAVRAAVPVMTGPEPAIVMVGSLNSRLPAGLVAPYSAAKAALVNVSKALAEELAGRGIRVNVVSPGPVRTPLWTGPGGFAQLLAEQAGTTPQDVMDRLLPETMAVSLGRVAEPAEIADLVLFLASPRARFVTGAEYVIDGGMLKSTG